MNDFDATIFGTFGRRVLTGESTIPTPEMASFAKEGGRIERKRIKRGCATQ
jgi:hypothetical protein